MGLGYPLSSLSNKNSSVKTRKRGLILFFFDTVNFFDKERDRDSPRIAAAKLAAKKDRVKIL